MRILNGKITTTGNQRQAAEIAATFERAVATYEKTRASLVHEDGTPKFGVRENKTMVEGAINQLKAAANTARNAAIALRDAAHSQRQAAYIDPLLQLTSDAERVEVAYKQLIIKESVEALPLGDLANQLRAMADHGTRAEQLLFVRYARPSLQKQHEAAINANQYTPGLRDALDALKALEAVALADTQARHKAAEEAATEAGKLIMRINLLEDSLLSGNPLVDVARRF